MSNSHEKLIPPLAPKTASHDTQGHPLPIQSKGFNMWRPGGRNPPYGRHVPCWHPARHASSRTRTYPLLTRCRTQLDQSCVPGTANDEGPSRRHERPPARPCKYESPYRTRLREARLNRHAAHDYCNPNLHHICEHVEVKVEYVRAPITVIKHIYDRTGRGGIRRPLDPGTFAVAGTRTGRFSDYRAANLNVPKALSAIRMALKGGTTRHCVLRIA